MKLSIIMPVYNGEKYVKKCIECLLQQDEKDVEIIVVNDGSSDRSAKIVEELSKTNTNVILINKENEGAGRARKMGIECASGEYIGFIDVDDWVEPHMFSTMLKEGSEKNAAIVCCGYFETSENGKVNKESNGDESTFEEMTGHEALLWMNKRKKIYSYLWNKIIKRELFENIDFPKGSFIGEDYFVLWQLFQKAEKVLWIPNSLYHYVQFQGSVSRGGYGEKHKISYVNYMVSITNQIKNYPQNKEIFENYFITEMMSFIVAMGRNKVYDKLMIQDVVSYVKRHKKQYIEADYVNFKFKLSAIAVCLNYKLLILGYKILEKV